jgi:RHS repeat-associated protein
MFQFRQEQFAALRRKKIGDGLIATFADGPVRAGWSERQNYVTASDPLGNQTRFGFDENGFLAAVASPLGRLWQIGNYPNGKPAILRNPAGHQLGLTYTPAGLLDTISSNGNLCLQLHYNERQMATAAGFPDGTYSSAEYTPWGAPWVMTNRLGLRDLCEYDEHRRLTGLTDGNGNPTRFVYSRWTRPDSTLFPNGTSESYAYSDKGFVTEIATEESRVELESDDKGRPVELRYSDGATISYKYDDKGRTAEAALADHVCGFAWNDAGLLEQEKCGDDELLYKYDKAGRLIGLTLPGGEEIAYAWDADSRLTHVRDWNGGEHRIQYAANDRGSLLTAPNSVDTLAVLNDIGRPESITVSRQSKPLFSLGYTFDNEDRVASLRDSAFGYRDFRCDPEGQLVGVDSQGESPSETFAYDGAGNPLDLNGKAAQYDAANQLLSLGHNLYDYDGRGNLIRMDTSEGIWRFTWNDRNLMARSESPSGVVTTYAYDGFGRRIGKQREGLTVDFFWAGEQMIGEVATTAEAIVRRDYLYSPGTFTPLAVRVDGEVYSYHCDHLGTPRMITAPDGTMVWLADYASFGGARVTHEALRNPLRAPGQYFDEETGLHYNRFRYYAPQLGRYLSRDPLGFLAGANFYSYAANSPINRADPLGLWDTGSLMTVAKGAAVVATVAVGAAVLLAFAPVSLPLAILAGGAAAAMVAGGLNEALNQNQFCASCIASAAGNSLAQFGSGLADATVKPLIQIATHPLDTAAAVGHAVMHPLETAKAVENKIVATGKAALSGDPKAMGQVAGTAAMLAVPGAGEAESAEKADLIAQRVAANSALKDSSQFAIDMQKAGVTEAQISAMFAKELPLGFDSTEQFNQFKAELDASLNDADLQDAEVGMKGTATTFYSENPGKPLGHYWDADPSNPGDYDLNLSSHEMSTQMEEAGISPSEKYGVYKTRDINATYPSLDEFQQKWSEILGRDVNFVGYPDTPPTRDPTEYILRSPE